MGVFLTIFVNEGGQIDDFYLQSGLLPSPDGGHLSNDGGCRGGVDGRLLSTTHRKRSTHPQNQKPGIIADLKEIKYLFFPFLQRRAVFYYNGFELCSKVNF